MSTLPWSATVVSVVPSGVRAVTVAVGAAFSTSNEPVRDVVPPLPSVTVTVTV